MIYADGSLEAIQAGFMVVLLDGIVGIPIAIEVSGDGGGKGNYPALTCKKGE